MNGFHRFAPLSLLALAVMASCSGCKSNPAPSADQNAASPPPGSDSSDPANANLAPVSDAQNAQPAPVYQPAPAPAPRASQPQPANDENYSQGGYDQAGYDPGSSSDYYGEQAEETAPQPPPPLPEYEQPPSPGDDYLWTPGYWNYASQG